MVALDVPEAGDQDLYLYPPRVAPCIPTGAAVHVEIGHARLTQRFEARQAILGLFHAWHTRARRPERRLRDFRGRKRRQDRVCYVADLTRAVPGLLDSGLREQVNLDNSKGRQMRVAEEMVKALALAPGIVFGAPPQDDPHLRRLDIAWARRLLGSVQTTGRGEGLRLTGTSLGAPAQTAVGALGAI
jgi:hypothetical protein